MKTDLMKKFLDLPGVEGVYAFTYDGFLIAHEAKIKLDTDALAGTCTPIAGATEGLGAELESKLEQIIVQFNNYIVVIEQISEDVIFVVLGRKDMNIGLVRLNIKRNKDKLRDMF